MKVQLEIGDKIQRFETQLTREVDYIYEIESVTKTLAKTSGGKSFKRGLIFDSKRPLKSTNKTIAEVRLNEKYTFTSPSYFLIE
jgi:hypothetical protein